MSATRFVPPIPAVARGVPRRQHKLVTAMIVVVGMAMGTICGWVWWEDRPLRLAEAALLRNDSREALRLANAYLAGDSQNGRAQGLKARALVGLNRWDEAIQIFSRHGAASFEELHALAQALLHLHHWSEALPVLDDLLKRQPKHADVLHEITACRSFLGRHDEALRSAQQLAELPGFEARGFVQLGTLHQAQRNRQSAVEAWSRVLTFVPDATNLQIPPHEFFLAYGGALLDNGQPREAIPVLERSVKSQDNAEAHTRLAEALTQLGDADRSLVEWKRVVELDPPNRLARETLAQLALEQGEATQAFDWLRPLAVTSGLPSTTTYLLQRIHLLLGHADEAALWQQRTDDARRREKLTSSVNQVLREAPLSFWARAVRAYRFAEQGNWIEADHLTQSLAREAPQEPFVRELSVAVGKRGPLPSLELLPIKLF
ncbi:MAG: tetratricopeptide repeat protein [Planctomycetales bacterium]|nr:tetratricopeptide repeat protein [Planctomycetales bacterium]